MKRSVSQLRGVSAITSIFILTAVFSAEGQTQKNPTAQVSDIKIRQKMTMSGGGGRGMETVIYVKGPRMRNEMLGTGMSMMSVRQCDLKRTITINDTNKTYLITPDEVNSATTAGGSTAGVTGATIPAEKRRGGVVTITNTITDTGERKELFGFTARHIKTSMTKETSPDACNKGNTKVEIDGWYIDFDYDFSCPMDRKKTEIPGVPSTPGCEDEIRTKTIGKGKLGYPVLTTTTIYGADGQAASTVTNEVIELSRAPLDAAMFDVPAGYRLAKDYQDLYGMGGATPSGNAGRPSSSPPVSSTAVPVSAAASAPAGFVSAASPKRDGVARIGVVMPKAQMTAGDSGRAAEAVRNTFATYLNIPNVELVALNSRLPSQALEEAKQSNCDYVLYSSLTQKKGGGGMFGKALGDIASSAVGHLPGGRNTGEAAARSATVTGVYTAADISGSIKSKDELTLEYKLESTDAARPPVANSAKAKAKSDGEDVFTPLVEKAAQAVVDAIAGK